MLSRYHRTLGVLLLLFRRRLLGCNRSCSCRLRLRTRRAPTRPRRTEPRLVAPPHLAPSAVSYLPPRARSRACRRHGAAVLKRAARMAQGRYLQCFTTIGVGLLESFYFARPFRCKRRLQLHLSVCRECPSSVASSMALDSVPLASRKWWRLARALAPRLRPHRHCQSHRRHCCLRLSLELLLDLYA